MIAALCLFIVDAFVFGWFCIAVIASVTLVLWHIPRTLLAMKRRDLLIVRALKTGIYSVMVAAIFAAYAGNNYLAGIRAETVVDAVHHFEADHHRYPESLSQLVPKYVRAVPRAKYTLMFSEFLYFKKGRAGPLLLYYGFPPFERRIYFFESKHWSVLD